MTSTHHHFNYIELAATDIEAMKTFYGSVFGWTFQDWAPTYASIHGAGVEGGMEMGERKPSRDGTLVILHSNDLEASEAAVKAAGAEISVPIFSFPGGRRFHFIDPSGNELAVWTKTET